MFCVPRKTIQKNCPGWQSSLVEQISRRYGDSANTVMRKSLKRFNFLQMSARGPEAPVKQILDYLGQVAVVHAIFPDFSPQVEWSHAFQRSTARERGVPAEQRALLFNLASSYMEEGSAMNDLVSSCKKFRYAAGLFQKISNSNSTMDAALTALCLAQAQECFYLKAVSEKMKAPLLCKLAAQTAVYYERAQHSSLPKDWGLYVNCKRDLFTAIAHQQQGKLCEEHNEQKVGEGIAHYRQAIALMENMHKFSHIEDYANRIENEITDALHGNPGTAGYPWTW